MLPSTDDALEDFQQLRRESAPREGDAMLLDSDFLEGVPGAVLEQMGREECDREYRRLVDAVNSLTTVSDADVARLRRQLAEIVRRDHFGACGRAAAEFAVRALSQRESR